jgi:acyl-homoserine-lactone acylase
VKREAGIEDVPVVIEETHHGPIVAHRDGKAYAARLSYQDEVLLFDQMLEMMTSRSLSGMREALERLQLMNQNIMVATVDGDIYYVRYGRVPIRPEGFDWSRPVPGNTSRTEWLGIHPLADLVQVVNPPQGYIQNCNVSPRWITDQSPLQPERYAPRGYLYDEETPHLHQRAAQTLAELRDEKRMTIERALEITQSVTVYNAERWQEMLRSAGDPGSLSGDAERVRDLVLAWDRKLERDSTNATAYLYWKEAVYAIPDELPSEKAVAGERRLGRAARLLDQGGLDPPAIPGEKLLLALDAAARDLRKDWSEVEVPYGRKFVIGREGSPRRFPVSGGSTPGASTPRALSWRTLEDGKTRLAVGGQSAVQVVVLTKPPTSFSLIPLGESDDPESPHFDDQAEKLMQWTRMKPTYFLKKDGPDGLLAHVKSVLVLQRPRR